MRYVEEARPRRGGGFVDSPIRRRGGGWTRIVQVGRAEMGGRGVRYSGTELAAEPATSEARPSVSLMRWAGGDQRHLPSYSGCALACLITFSTPGLN